MIHSVELEKKLKIIFGSLLLRIITYCIHALALEIEATRSIFGAEINYSESFPRKILFLKKYKRQNYEIQIDFVFLQFELTLKCKKGTVGVTIGIHGVKWYLLMS